MQKRKDCRIIFDLHKKHFFFKDFLRMELYNQAVKDFILTIESKTLRGVYL